MEVVGPVRVMHQYVNMPEQKAEFYNETTGKLEEVNVACLKQEETEEGRKRDRDHRPL